MDALGRVGADHARPARDQQPPDAAELAHGPGRRVLRILRLPAFGKGKPHGIRITVSFKAPRGTPETPLANITWNARTLIHTSVRDLAAGVIGAAKMRMKEVLA